MPCCKAEAFGGWCANEPTLKYKGEAYCLFHAPAECPQKQDVAAFNAKVFARIDACKAAEESCDLGGTIFPGEIDFAGYGKDNPLPVMDVARADFNGDAEFNGVTFGGDCDFTLSTFRGKLNLTLARFVGEACFDNAKFNYITRFDEAVFSSSSSFIAAKFFCNPTFCLVVFKGQAKFQEAIFNNNCDFKAAEFAGNCDFVKAEFSGQAIFIRSKFNGYSDFSEAQFYKNVYFDQAKFNGESNFNSTVFLDYIDFNFVLFNGYSDFSETKFYLTSEFNAVKFVEDVTFCQADFYKQVNFVQASFLGTAEFHSVRVLSGADFSKSLFELKADFFNATLHNTVFNMAHFKRISYFRHAELHGGSFEDCTVDKHLEFERANLRKLMLLRAPIESMLFIDCTWPESNGRKVVYDARFVQGRGYFPLSNVFGADRFSEANDPAEPGRLADLFRRLKKVARLEADESLASDWHYAEKEMQRLDARQSKRRWFALGLWLYKISSGYGERPLPAFCWLLFLILFPWLCNVALELVSALLAPDPLPDSQIIVGLKAMFAEPSHCILPTLNGNVAGCYWYLLWLRVYQALILTQTGLFVLAVRNKMRR